MTESKHSLAYESAGPFKSIFRKLKRQEEKDEEIDAMSESTP